MIDPRREIVLIEHDGQWKDRTCDIASCEAKSDGSGFEIRFVNSPKTYRLGARSVSVVRGALPVSVPLGAAVEVDGTIWPNAKEVWQFDGGLSRVFYSRRGGEESYSTRSSTNIHIVANAGHAPGVQETIGYWKALVAAQSADDPLRQPFEGLDFIREDSALARILTGSPIESRAPHVVPIYPFRSNLSQREAIDTALSHSISVIEGPPGTGKTETILNLLATIMTMSNATVAVVSYGNAAVKNVRDKLTEGGYRFVVADLGARERVEQFFKNQSKRRSAIDEFIARPPVAAPSTDAVCRLNEQLARLQIVDRDRVTLHQQIDAYRLELQHFERHLQQNELPNLDRLPLLRRTSDRILDYLADTELRQEGDRPRLLARVRRYLRYGALRELNPDDTGVVLRLQQAFYHRKLDELTIAAVRCEKELARANFDALVEELQRQSQAVLQASLTIRYRSLKDSVYDPQTYRSGATFERFVQDHPILLSTCHSLRRNLPDGHLLDYLIIDEASQVNLLAAALALSSCRNLIVVGDRQQLSHIPPKKSDNLVAPNPAFDCVQHNLLSMLDTVFEDRLPRTLLREHYRCDPAIIGYCNKAFYANQLIPFTTASSAQPMIVYRTTEGNHMRQHAGGGRTNQREIDVIRNEVIPKHCANTPDSDIGVMAPYRRQVHKATDALLARIEADTVHKFQGRQKDVVILTTVLDETWRGHTGLTFVDDPHLVNVAVSRAVKRFVLVTNNDLLPKSRHLRDLIGYIRYHNPDQEVTDSEIVSIFDLLYQQYSARLRPLAARRRRELKYDSEDIAWTLLHDILADDRYSHLTVSNQILVRSLLPNLDGLTPRQLEYVRHRASVDFVVYNRVTNRPLLAIEVDGFAYHENKPDQLVRDALKDEILRNHGLPLLRLPTTGSGEDDHIRRALEATALAY